MTIGVLGTTAQGYSTGGNAGNGAGGCGGLGCHAVEARSTIIVRVDGLPDAVDAGARYDLKVAVEGPQYPRPREPGLVRAGYAVDADAGTLAAVGTSSHLIGTTLTHNLEGARNTSWAVRWTAPTTPGPVALHVTGMIAENSSVNQEDDLWNTETFGATVRAHGSAGAAAWASILVACVALLIERHRRSA